MNLWSGMRSTNKNGLDPVALCAIIKQCGESGVQEFKWGDLHVLFSISGPPGRLPGIVHTLAPLKSFLQEEVLPENEESARENQMEQLKLTDPVAYENLVTQGRIDSADSERSE